ncbi:MAG TPA: SRPBCC family protein [Candidatus Acidoferrum sp.]|nr:SRPBCC family protein [Candidatus Acidoferrum sp.]
MELQRATHATIVIERNFPVPPQRVFGAFSDIEKKRKWFAPDEGAKILSHEMDFRVGGKEMKLLQFGEFPPCTNETNYLVIIPNHRIVIAYTMTMGGHTFSSSHATFEFSATEAGTNMLFTEQAAFFENSDGPKMREEGWTKLIDQLARTLAN